MNIGNMVDSPKWGPADENRKFLKNHSLFKGYSGIDALAKKFIEIKKPANSALINEGEEESEFYIVKEGRLEVTLESKHLSFLEKGEYCGEMTPFLGAKRSADITAVEDTRLLMLQKADFDDLLQDEWILESFIKETVKRIKKGNTNLAANSDITNTTTTQEKKSGSKMQKCSFKRAVQWEKGDEEAIKKSIFNNVPPAILRLYSTVAEVPKGYPLIEKGEDGKALYLILSGEVEVHDGLYKIGNKGIGKDVGMMSLVTEKKTCASIITISKTRLLKIESNEFLMIKKGNIPFLRIVLTELFQDLLNDNKKNKREKVSEKEVKEADANNNANNNENKNFSSPRGLARSISKTRLGRSLSDKFSRSHEKKSAYLEFSWKEPKDTKLPILSIKLEETLRSWLPEQGVIPNVVTINGETFFNRTLNAMGNSRHEFFKNLLNKIYMAGIDPDINISRVEEQTEALLKHVKTDEKNALLDDPKLVKCLNILRLCTINSWAYADQIIRIQFPNFKVKKLMGMEYYVKVNPKGYNGAVIKSSYAFFTEGKEIAEVPFFWKLFIEDEKVSGLLNNPEEIEFKPDASEHERRELRRSFSAPAANLNNS